MPYELNGKCVTVVASTGLDFRAFSFINIHSQSRLEGNNNPYLLFPSSRDWQRMLINKMPGSVPQRKPQPLRNCHFIRKAFDTHGIKSRKPFLFRFRRWEILKRQNYAKNGLPKFATRHSAQTGKFRKPNA